MDTHPGEAPVYAAAQGTTSLIISLPHVGTGLPEDIAARMTPRGRRVEDTDWNVDQLYGFARALGASWLQPRLSRYVVDLNRPPGDEALYPGQASTGLCPALTFDGEPLYTGAAPDAAEVQRRREQYWTPYHRALEGLIAHTQAEYGYAIVLDAHSIRSQVPRLFEGRLPDLNIGTHDGRSCAPALAESIMAVLGRQQAFTHVLNGRFKGGFITRGYGAPAARVHAVQIEIAQSAYMDESGREWDAARAAPLVALLRQIVGAMLEFRPATAGPA